MIRIHILDLPAARRFIPVPADWYPLYINRRYFHDLGITWHFFSAPDPKLNDCDFVFLSSRYFELQTKNADDHSRQLSYIASLKTHTTKLYWFDFRDSTGNTQFEVLPYVDLYLKKQMLRDLSLYSSTYYGNRIYTDFIHRIRGVTDDYTESCLPLLPQFHPKLKISWNPGLLDFRGGLPRHLIMQQLMDRWETRFSSHHHINWQSPLSRRPYNMLARFNTRYQRRTISWQRRHVQQFLRAINDPLIISRPDLTLSEELAYRRQVKIVLSLFGWGEICSRDFQAWIAGAALIAPDTSHLVTYPATHIPGQTYLPIKWDLSDLSLAYRHLLDDPALRLSLAEIGQTTYRQVWSKQGRQSFVSYISGLLRDSSSPVLSSPVSAASFSALPS